MSSFSAQATAYFAGHAINPRLAWECGVRERSGSIVWPTVDASRDPSPRYRRLADGPGPKVRGLRNRTLGVWWPLGRPERVEGDVLVCEGESDAMAAASLLAPSDGVFVASGHVRTETLANELLDVGATVAALAFDGDIAGGQSADRLALELVANGIGARILAVPYDQDLASVLAGVPTPDGPWPQDPLAWLREALLRARPVGLEVAALVAENRWLRTQLLDGGATPAADTATQATA
jgi:hypothetical protein